VAAATGLNSIEETIELNRTAAANGGPHGIVGGLPPTDSVAEAVDFLDRQMAAPLFRGVRPMGAKRDLVPDPEILRALKDRDLVFDLMAFAGELRTAAEALARVDADADAPQVVIEHTGWPQSGSTEEFAVWKEGMRALADLGPHVACKLSGLAMPLQTMDRSALAPWIEFAIETFGTDRCLFASNFPVDATYGTYDDLYETFSAVTSGLDHAARDQLFAGTAERIYRL
jgi:predicted TIM-barrel fold metal-dependent hydrolase